MHPHRRACVNPVVYENLVSNEQIQIPPILPAEFAPHPAARRKLLHDFSSGRIFAPERGETVEC